MGTLMLYEETKMIISDAAKRKMEEIKIGWEEERLAEKAIQTYSICPYCAKSLLIEKIPSKRDTWFRHYIDGFKQICPEHGVLYVQEPLCREDMD